MTTSEERAMDIDKEMAGLREAFPGVGWTDETVAGEPATFVAHLHGRRLGEAWVTKESVWLFWPKSVLGNSRVTSDKGTQSAAEAVKVWLDQHPICALLKRPEPAGETVEVKGWVSVADSGEICVSGMEAAAYHQGTEQEEADARVMSNGASVIAGYPFTLRVPKPKPAPTLIGEVCDE